MTDRPAPLTPRDCDCRGLPFMPLEVQRLRDSDFVAISTGDEFKAGILLWGASWSQVPAGSLPDDERVLARLAGCNVRRFRVLRKGAMHGFVLCSDDRYYHPVIAARAIDAFARRWSQKARSNAKWARIRGENPIDSSKPPIQGTVKGTDKESKGFFPEPIRSAVAAAQGEAWTRSWLDPCRWRDGAIATPNAFTADTLRRELAAVLSGVAVVVEVAK